MITALVLIDFQNDYFPGGKWMLEGIEQAAGNAASLLAAFRERDLPVIHIRHEFPISNAPFFAPGSEGAKTHPRVAPLPHEPVVLKHEINGFLGTQLEDILDARHVDRLLICGAMSHMCIDGTTRAAHDLGYACIVASDACATHAMKYEGIEVPAQQVHTAFMAALGFAYAQVMPTARALLEVIQSASVETA